MSDRAPAGEWAPHDDDGGVHDDDGILSEGGGNDSNNDEHRYDGGFGDDEQDWTQDRAAGNDGSPSYGYDEVSGEIAAAPQATEEDYPSAVDVAGTGNELEQWQWVQDDSNGGYYYNAVTGEARWDDPTAFQESTNEALVERGHDEMQYQQQQQQAGRDDTTGAVPAYGGAALTEYQGVDESYTFTAEDGTMWRYDEAGGDYEQIHEQDDQVVATTAAGSPWRCVADEHGRYYYYNDITQESSWDPPGDWGEVEQVPPQEWEAPSTTTTGVQHWYDATADQESNEAFGDEGQAANADVTVFGASGVGLEEESSSAGLGGGGRGIIEGYSAGEEVGVRSLSESVGGGGGGGEGGGGKGGRMDVYSVGEEVGVRPSSESVLSASEPKSQAIVRAGEGSGGGGEGGIIDQRLTGEASDWSVEKLREISKTLTTGKNKRWVVSDFLSNRATEDYDRLLELDEFEIEDLKSKGTSRIVRSLVGPEDGEDGQDGDDDDDKISLSQSVTDSIDHPDDDDDLPSSVGILQTKKPSFPTIPTAGAVGGRGGMSAQKGITGGYGRMPPGKHNAKPRAVLTRQRSLLGLRQATGGTSEGLGAWKPALATDGSLYFVHQETGESTWTFPVRNWEVRVRQLAMLTPRTPYELGRGVCRLRETDEMRKKRLAYRWRVEDEISKEAVRRRENPSTEEATKDAMEEIITIIERQARRERQLVHHKNRVEERVRWHPSTAGFSMKRLVLCTSARATATGVTAAEEDPNKQILTDAAFMDMKLTQGGSALACLPGDGRTPPPPPPPTTTKGRAKKRRFDIRRTLPHAPAPSTFLPAVKAFHKRTRSMCDLKGGQKRLLPAVKALGNIKSTEDLWRGVLAGVKYGERLRKMLPLPPSSSLVAESATAAVESRSSNGNGVTGRGGVVPKATTEKKDGQVKATHGSNGIADMLKAEVADTTAEEVGLSILNNIGPRSSSGRDRNRGAASDGRKAGDDTASVPKNAGGDGNPSSPKTAPKTKKRGKHPRAGDARHDNIEDKQEELPAAVLEGHGGVDNAKKKTVRDLGSTPARDRSRPTNSPKSAPEQLEDGGKGPTVVNSDNSSISNRKVPSPSRSPPRSRREPGRGVTATDTNKIKGDAVDEEPPSRSTGGLAYPALLPPNTDQGLVAASHRPLTATGLLDEQVRGLGAMLALKIEGPRTVSRTAVLGVHRAAAAKTLTKFGEAIQRFRKTRGGAAEPTSAAMMNHPRPPPDTSRVTLQLVCKPPPFNLLTTTRVKDPATGKEFHREELSSVLRDAWEGMLVRDIATAGGIDVRQVIIEEVRRDKGPFPLEISRRQHASRLGGDGLPFRPEKRDMTHRRRKTPPILCKARAGPSAATEQDTTWGGGTLKVGLRGRAPALLSSTKEGHNKKTCHERGKKPNPQRHGRVNVSNHGEDAAPAAAAAFGETLALSLLQPAGFRNTLARRLRRPIATSRRRAGMDGRRGRVSGKVVESNDAGYDLKERGIFAEEKNNVPMGLEQERPRQFLDHHPSEVIGSSTKPTSRKRSWTKSMPQNKYIRKCPDPATDDAESQVDDHDGAIGRGKHGCDVGNANEISESQSGRCPETVAIPPAPPGEATSSATGGPSPEIQVAANSGAVANGTSSLSGNRERWRTKQEEGGGGTADSSFVEREAVARGLDGTHTSGVGSAAAGPAIGVDEWKRTSFADKTAADDQAVGFGASNRHHGAFLAPSRAKQRGAPIKKRLRRVEEILFEPIEEARKADYSQVQEALEEAAWRDPRLTTWQAKDSVMRAMNPRQRIPTVHELRLAARVERARALFGPGGYLPSGGTSSYRKATPDGGRIRGATVSHAFKHKTVEGYYSVSGDTRKMKEKIPVKDDLKLIVSASDGRGVEKEAVARTQLSPRSPPSSARESKRLLPSLEEASPTEKSVETPQEVQQQQQQKQRNPETRKSSTDGSPREQRRPEVSSVRQTGGNSDISAMKLDGIKIERSNTDTDALAVYATGMTADSMPNSALLDKMESEKALSMMTTTVTFTIVGGRPCGRGFNNLQQQGKTSSEAVACFIAGQVGFDGSDLLQGGLTHTTVSACWCPASRGRVMDKWEGYWCHSISPVFFGRNTRSRFISSKAETRRRRVGEAEDTQYDRNSENTAEAVAVADAMEIADTGMSVGATSAARTIGSWDMTPNERLEVAEIRLQELLAEGLADGTKMTPEQYRAMLKRDRAIKRVLLHRKLKSKREGGGMCKEAFPYRYLGLEEIRKWKEEIQSAERVHLSERRADATLRREERMKESKKRGGRNQLKSWLLRHLVARNGNNADLMAKSIALQDHEDGAAGASSAARGAPGRESSTTARHARPGGRFAYNQEVSAKEMENRNLIHKAKHRFEADNDALLRATFKAVYSSKYGGSRPTTRGSTPEEGNSVGVFDISKAQKLVGGNNSKAERGGVPTDGVNVAGEYAAGGNGAESVATADRADATAATTGGSGIDTTGAATVEGIIPIQPSRSTNHQASVPATISAGQQESRCTSDEKAVDGPSTVIHAEPKTMTGEEHTSDNGDLPPTAAEPVAITVPRQDWLRLLRQQGTLRSKGLDSAAIRPILTDGDFTKAFLSHPGSRDGTITEDELALFGSVVAEVDHWYKRVRATLDPVRARAEERVNSFETRKKRARETKASRKRDTADGLAPSDRWRRELSVARKTNRGDGRDWSRFHHHVLIKTSPTLPLYCCLCRRRKWDEARAIRLKEEHSWRTSWELVLGERQDILQPMVQAEVWAALDMDNAVCNMDAASLAALHTLETLVRAVSGRVVALEVVGCAIESMLDGVMRQSCSIEERTRKRRMAALGKLRAMKAFQGGTGGAECSTSNNRRRSRRVSVGPSPFGVLMTEEGVGAPLNLAPTTAGAATQADDSRAEVKNATSENDRPSQAPATDAGTLTSAQAPPADDAAAEVTLQPSDPHLAQRHAATRRSVATMTAKRENRRGFAAFSDEAKVLARSYYDAPRGVFGARVKATSGWARLREVWFREQEYDGKGLDYEKASALEACVVEVLEGERDVWERQERERRGMFNAEELQRRDDESLRRVGERIPRERQEAGHRAFCSMVDTMERRSQSIARLRWELTPDLGNTQNMTTRVRDATTGKRFICRLLPRHREQDVERLLKEVYRIKEIGCPALVKIQCAHPHRIATYDERGLQTTGGEVVLILTEFCSGGPLQEHLNLMLAAPSSTTATPTVNTGMRAFNDKARGRNNADKTLSGDVSDSDRHDDRALVGPKGGDFHTPGSETTVSEAEGAADQNMKKSDVLRTKHSDDGGRGPALDRDTETVMIRGGGSFPTRRMEAWLTQVAHGLSALHADGAMHLNINAGNVYIDEAERAKLGSYECLKLPACTSEDSHNKKREFGCATTAPPEFELHGEISPKGDVWSLGCALYKWTTGKEFAFVAAGARLQDALHLVPPSCGDKIKTALFMCLQRDPGVRVSSLELWKYMAASGGLGNTVVPAQ